MAKFFVIPQNPNVPYQGKVLPRDKAPIRNDPEDPTVNYNGKQLPRDTVLRGLAPPDLSNNPKLVILGGIQLPIDVLIFINGEKVLAISKILDGVSVIERIGREPYEIEFEATLRVSLDGGATYIFPMDALDTIWQKIWLPDTVQKLTNTLLNKLGVQEVVVRSVHPTTIRGNKNVPFRIKCIENVPGSSLTITP